LSWHVLWLVWDNFTLIVHTLFTTMTSVQRKLRLWIELGVFRVIRWWVDFWNLVVSSQLERVWLGLVCYSRIWAVVVNLLTSSLSILGVWVSVSSFPMDRLRFLGSLFSPVGFWKIVIGWEIVIKVACVCSATAWDRIVVPRSDIWGVEIDALLMIWYVVL
jgi:hypothetical protein